MGKEMKADQLRARMNQRRDELNAEHEAWVASAIKLPVDISQYDIGKIADFLKELGLTRRSYMPNDFKPDGISYYYFDQSEEDAALEFALKFRC